MAPKCATASFFESETTGTLRPWPMDGRPAVGALADPCRDALLAHDRDQVADQAGPVAVVHLRQADRRRTHAARCLREARLLGPAWHQVVGRILFSAGAAWHSRNARSDDQGLAAAREHLTQGLDGDLVDLAIARELREIVNEAGVHAPIGQVCATTQGVQIREAGQ